MNKPNKVTGLEKNTSKLLNTVANEIGGEFKDAVPEVVSKGQQLFNGVKATKEDALMSVRQFGEVVRSNKGFMNDFIDTLLNRIALVIITSKSYENPWKFLKRGMIEYGDIIEDIFIDICEPHAYDMSAAENEVEKREIPDVKSMLYQVNSQVFYKQTIGERELRKAFMSYNGLYDLVTGIIRAMYTSMEIDERLAMKYILAKRMLNGGMYNYVLPENATAENKITAVKTISNLLMTPSTQYNQAGVMNFALKDEQFVFVTAEFDALSGVEVLAKAFNVDYVQFSGRYVVLDSFSFTETELNRLDVILGQDPAYTHLSEEELTALKSLEMCVVDKDFFMVFDNLIEFTDRLNQQGLYRNNWLHVWKIYASGYFANGIMFTNAEQTVTEVKVIPNSVTLNSGVDGVFQFNAQVLGSDFSNKAVTWEVTGDEQYVTVDKNTGIVNVKAGAKDSYTVTATSKEDESKKGIGVINITPIVGG